MQKHNPESICLFPSIQTEYKESDGLDIFNFVYEPMPLKSSTPEVCQTYRIYLVVSGSGTLVTDFFSYDIKKGDCFFCFPHKRFSYDNMRNLRLMYISFSNLEANSLLKQFNITYTSPIIREHEELIPIFKKEFQICRDSENITNGAKGVLYLCFNHFLKENNNVSIENRKKDAIKEIVNFISKNYADSNLSLKSISEQYFYHFNYLSQLFKEIMGISFVNYLTSVRLKNAQTLLKTSNLKINDVAKNVGFDDAHYFNRVFKKITGLTPSKYRALYQPK